jgi:hypothetical protein
MLVFDDPGPRVRRQDPRPPRRDTSRRHRQIAHLAKGAPIPAVRHVLAPGPSGVSRLEREALCAWIARLQQPAVRVRSERGYRLSPRSGRRLEARSPSPTDSPELTSRVRTNYALSITSASMRGFERQVSAAQTEPNHPEASHLQSREQLIGRPAEEDGAVRIAQAERSGRPSAAQRATVLAGIRSAVQHAVLAQDRLRATARERLQLA